MRKELSFEYDINANNMLDFTEADVKPGWTISEAEFYPNGLKPVLIKVLTNGTNPGESGAKQIFKMNDNTFVLEIEEEDVEYFYSEDLADLV